MSPESSRGRILGAKWREAGAFRDFQSVTDLERELTAVQFEAQIASHMIHLILDSKQLNNLFSNPFSETGAHILVQVYTAKARKELENC